MGTAVLLWITGSLAASFAGMFVILFGLALLVPAATVGLSRCAGLVYTKLFGRLGAIAARTVDRASEPHQRRHRSADGGAIRHHRCGRDDRWLPRHRRPLAGSDVAG